MSAPSTTALAALLASHPEECAAVVALLVGAGDRGFAPEGLAAIAPCDEALTAEIVTALRYEGVVFAGWPSGCVYMHRDTDRAAIARMGAAAWLAARVAPCG